MRFGHKAGSQLRGLCQVVEVHGDGCFPLLFQPFKESLTSFELGLHGRGTSLEPSFLSVCGQPVDESRIGLPVIEELV